MSRSNRPRRSGAPVPRGGRTNKWTRPRGEELPLERTRFGVPQLQDAPDGQWHVRRISPVKAEKSYTCPGCGHQIPPGVEHIVAWRSDHWGGDEASAKARRHWHSNCWNSRSYRY